MGRMIDADALTDEIKETKKLLQKGLGKDAEFAYMSADSVLKTIYNQPTAYDPDKVVEQLEDYGNEETRYYKNTPYEKCIEECIGKAIEIVKGGGVDAKTDS